MLYSAPLDGIRAIAILAVFVFHISPTALRGGFTGVDVFFVLSGFLITSIIVHDIRDGKFALGEFYLRRAQRLLPNSILTVLVVVALWTALLPMSAATQAARHGFWTLCNLSNFYIRRAFGGYWGDSAGAAPLLHTWSLAVEEQFYFVFPSTILLLARFQRPRVFPWLVMGAIGGFGLCLYGTYTRPVATFYLMPTRIWELLLGGALAAYRTPLCPDKRTSPLGLKRLETTGWVCLTMVLASCWLINERTSFPGLASLAPTVGTLLVILAVADGGTKFARLLSAPPLVWVGKRSYSLYLWHWPLIVLGKMEADVASVPSVVGAAVGGLVSILVASLVYAAVEVPLRNRGHGRRKRLVAIGMAFSLVALGSWALGARSVVIDPSHRFEKPSFSGLLYDAARTAVDPTPGARYRDVYFPPIPPGKPEPWREGGVLHLYGGKHPSVVVLGSSHALMYSRIIDDICRQQHVSVAFLGVDATPAFFTEQVNEHFPTRHDAQEFDKIRRARLREWHPDAVFVIDKWDSRLSTPQRFQAELRSFLAEVSPLAGRIFFVAQIPVAKWGEEVNLREFMLWRARWTRGPVRLEIDQNDGIRKQAVAVAQAATSEFANLRILRPDQAFYAKDGAIRWGEGRSFYYLDDDHLSDTGTEVIRDLFRSAVTEASSSARSR